MAVNDNPVSIENLKGTIELAKEFLRALHLANGGAVVGLLTFYGNIAAQGKGSTIAVDKLAFALNLFAWGLIAGLATSAFAYLSQLIAATCEGSPWQIRLRYTSFACAVVSLSLFVAGTDQAGESFTSKAFSSAAPKENDREAPVGAATSTTAGVAMARAITAK